MKYIALLLGFFGSTQAMDVDMIEMFNIADDDAAEYVFKDSEQNKKVFKAYIKNVRSNNTSEYQKFITAVYTAQKLKALGNPEQTDAQAHALQIIQKTLVVFSAQQQQLVQKEVMRNNNLKQRNDSLVQKNATSMAVATCVNAVTLLAFFVLLSYVGNHCA